MPRSAGVTGEIAGADIHGQWRAGLRRAEISSPARLV